MTQPSFEEWQGAKRRLIGRHPSPTLTRIRGSASSHKGHFSDGDDPEGFDVGKFLKLLARSELSTIWRSRIHS